MPGVGIDPYLRQRARCRSAASTSGNSEPGSAGSGRVAGPCRDAGLRRAESLGARESRSRRPGRPGRGGRARLHPDSDALGDGPSSMCDAAMVSPSPVTRLSRLRSSAPGILRLGGVDRAERRKSRKDGGRPVSSCRRSSTGHCDRPVATTGGPRRFSPREERGGPSRGRFLHWTNCLPHACELGVGSGVATTLGS